MLEQAGFIHKIKCSVNVFKRRDTFVLKFLYFTLPQTILPLKRDVNFLQEQKLSIINKYSTNTATRTKPIKKAYFQ